MAHCFFDALQECLDSFCCCCTGLMKLWRQMGFDIASMIRGKCRTGNRPQFPWTPRLVTEFTKLAAEEFGPPKKDYGIYRRLAIRFTELTGHHLSTKQARSKCKSRRRGFLKWEKLKNTNGASWDNVLNTIAGDSDWWEDRTKEFGREILKYRTAPIPDLEYLEQMFRPVAADTSAIEPNDNFFLPNVGSNAILDTEESNWNQKSLLLGWNLKNVPFKANENEADNDDDPPIIDIDADKPFYGSQFIFESEANESQFDTRFSAARRERKRASNIFMDDVDTTMGYKSRRTRVRSSSSERSDASVPCEHHDPIIDDAKAIMDRCMSLGGRYEQWELTSLVLKINFRRGVKILTDDEQARKWVESEVQALRERR